MPAGQRCEARSKLEIDHRISRAKGGTNELLNLRAYCRAHNRLHAEEVFGREHVEAKIAQRRKP